MIKTCNKCNKISFKVYGCATQCTACGDVTNKAVIECPDCKTRTGFLYPKIGAMDVTIKCISCAKEIVGSSLEDAVTRWR